MSRTQQWVTGTALVAVLILAAGWFLLITPARSEAAELRASTQQQDRANAQLVSRIEELKVQSEDLPSQLARLAELGIQIPSNPELPTLIRDLTAAAESSGALMVSMAPSTPTLLPSSVPVPVVAPVPAEGENVGDDDPAAAAAAAPPAPAADPLYMVPLTVTLEGTYYELEQWLNKVEDLKRAQLVTGFTLRSEVTATGEVVDKDRGPLSLTVSTRVFMTTAQPPAPTAVVAPVPPAAPASPDAPVDTAPATPTS